MPELNTALLAKVRDQITAVPELHEQDDFENPLGECGVTRCVAGWAILIDALDKGESVTSFRQSTAYQDSGKAPSGFARKLLGLTDEEAENLFFQTDNEEAVGIVKAAAEGVRPPASDVED